MCWLTSNSLWWHLAVAVHVVVVLAGFNAHGLSKLYVYTSSVGPRWTPCWHPKFAKLALFVTEQTCLHYSYSSGMYDSELVKVWLELWTWVMLKQRLHLKSSLRRKWLSLRAQFTGLGMRYCDGHTKGIIHKPSKNYCSKQLFGLHCICEKLYPIARNLAELDCSLLV